MRAWIVRFASLYVFNVVVLLVIGLLTPAKVGWAVLWASIILTLAELFIRPIVQKTFAGAAAKSAGERTRIGEAVVQGAIVLAVAAVIWVITVLLSGVDLGGGWFWALVLPPIILAIGWGVYARIDMRLQAKTGELYDKAEAGIRGQKPAPAASTTPEPATKAELADGLTPEQRKMLDDLGS